MYIIMRYSSIAAGLLSYRFMHVLNYLNCPGKIHHLWWWSADYA